MALLEVQPEVHRREADRALRRAMFAALIFASYLIFAIVGQQHYRAVAAGFGLYPDEPAHYVSGLMVHDYLLSGMRQKPLEYASNYYVRLPEIAIGHWPPVFYGMQGIWMMIFGWERSSMLLLVASITALLGLSVYLATKNEFGAWGAWAAGFAVLMLPAVRWSNNFLMSDVLTGAAVLWAALAFGRYVDSERWQDAMLFAGAASLALMIKPAAICLAVLPPLVILATGRFRLLARRALWGSAGVILLVCGAWYYSMYRLASYGLYSTPFGEHIRKIVPGYFLEMGPELGILSIPFIVGLWAIFTRRKQISAKWISLACLPVAVLVSLMYARVGIEPRYLLPGTVPAVLVACYGLFWIATRVANGTGRPMLRLAIFLVGVAAYAATIRTIPYITRNDEIAQLVRDLAKTTESANGVALVCGKEASEGRVIAEIAMRKDQRPTGLMLLRGTKVLAEMEWNAENYRSRYGTADELAHALDRLGIKVVVIDTSERREFRHDQLLREAIQKDPQRWHLISKYPAAGPAEFEMYQFDAKTRESHTPPAMKDEIQQKLGLIN